MKKQLPLRMLLVAWFAAFGLLACDVTQIALAPSSPPTVSIGSPPHGAEFRTGQEILVQANATDNVGIVRVELWVDGVLVTTAQPPATQKQFAAILRWTPTPGTHILTVKAVNSNSATSQPAAVSINVIAPPEPTKLPTLPPTAIPPAISTALPTPSSTITPPMPSRTPECPPPAPLPAGTLFSDNFSSQQVSKCNGWTMESGANLDYTWAMNKYTIAIKKQNWVGLAWPDGEYDNFAVEIEAQPAGDTYAEYGISFRSSGTENTRNYYNFGVTSDGKYSVLKKIAGTWSDLDPVKSTTSPTIKLGNNKNLLGVVAQGNTFGLYINRTFIRAVTDTDLPSKGKVGIFTATGSNTNTTVVFNRMTIYAPDRGKWD